MYPPDQRLPLPGINLDSDERSMYKIFLEEKNTWHLRRLECGLMELAGVKLDGP